jgi:hypothetical protein
VSITKSQQAKTIEEIADELENEIKMLTEILRLLRADSADKADKE